jgi:hypothetical protein
MNRYRIVSGLVIFSLSVIALIWALFPTSRISRFHTLQPILLQAPESTTAADRKSINSSSSVPPSVPLVMDNQQVLLEFPSQIRYGDTEIVQLMIKPIDQAESDGFENIDGLLFETWGTYPGDLYEKFFAIAEARLDLVGMDVKPSDLISEPLHSGGSATFFWSIKPVRAGSYQGTAWLYIRILDPSTGLETRKVVTAQIMEIKVVDFQGLSTTWVQVLASINLAVSVFLLFPFIDKVKNPYRTRLLINK